MAEDQVIVAVAAPLGELRGVDTLALRVNAHRLKVLGEGFDDRFQRGRTGRGERKLQSQRLTVGVAAHAVIAYGPACRFQQPAGAAQVSTVAQPFGGRGMRHQRRFGQNLGGHKVAQRLQQRQFVTLGHALCLQPAALGVGIALGHQPVLQLLIGPFEVVGQRDRLAHTAVLKIFLPQIEHESGGCGRGANRDLLAHDIATIDRRKIIADRPLPRVPFGAEGIFAGLERFERGGVIAKILDAHGIEIVPPGILWQIGAPVIRVAPIGDAAVYFIAVQHVGPGPGRGFKP